MKRRITELGALIALCVSPLFACQEDTSLKVHEPAPIDSTTSAIIGGLPANSVALNAVGMLGMQVNYDGYTYFSPFCSGTLVGERTVLTAKHCTEAARSADGKYTTAYFALGPDAMHPVKLVEIVDTESAPGDLGGFVGYGRDVGTVHLAEKIPASFARPMKTAALTPAMVDTNFAILGYGDQDNSGTYGTRRVGTVKLRALSGQVFALIFGSFEAFRDWYLGLGYYGGIVTTFASDAGRPRPIDADVPDGGAIAVDAYDWLTEYLLSLYNETVLLEGYEAYVGNAPGNAQPCFGDSGGPLLRMVNGELTIYGVTSGGINSSTLICDFGGVYATFGPAVAAFLKTSLAWQDPCEGLSRLGVCKRSASQRCTYPGEGKRRVVVTDCSLLGQTCVIASDGQALCAYPGEDPLAGLPGTGGVVATGGSRPPSTVTVTSTATATATGVAKAPAAISSYAEARAYVDTLVAQAQKAYRPAFLR
jgi:hypothetical protein